MISIPAKIKTQKAPGLLLTDDLEERFLESLREQGRSAGTISGYRRYLDRLRRSLPEDMMSNVETVTDLQQELLDQGYSPSAVNVYTAAANSLFCFAGRRELQVPPVPSKDPNIQPELSRNEYLRLLSTAHALKNFRTYFLVKVFAVVGINIQDLPLLTAEAAEEGQIVQNVGRGRQIIRIPACLREELLEYGRRERIWTGPIFVTKNGKALSRTAVTACIQRLAGDARVAPEKCNPRCLRKLCHTTQKGIRANLDLLAEQAYDRLLENEQIDISWRD